MATNIGNSPALQSSSGSYEETYKAEAAAVLGVSNLIPLWHGFGDGASIPWTVSLPNGGQGSNLQINNDDTAGIVPALQALGGTARFITGTGTTGISQLFPSVGGVVSAPPYAAYADATVRFYRASQMLIETAPTADTVSYMGSLNWGMGVFGANSTTNFSLRVGDPALVTPIYITSTVTITAGTYPTGTFPILRSWHDGVNAWFKVNNEAAQSAADLSLWPISTSGKSYPLWRAEKVGGAVSHIFDATWGLWMVQRP